MATIDQIIRDGKGSAGSNGAWTVYRHAHCCKLYHYSTQMLVWDPANPANDKVLDYSTGWGSVSDQGGMNRAFRVLNLPLRYDRAGGAAIVRLVKNVDGYWCHPSSV